MAERLITDLGGLPAGEIPREEYHMVFWEKQMIATFNVLWDKKIYNLDEFRRMVESIDAELYKHSNFYRRRLDGMIDLCVEKGLVDPDELESRTQAILKAGTRDHVA
jgi:nitrile hydratase